MAGGGSGGHIIPNIALLEALRKQDSASWQVLYLGSDRGMEAQLIPASGYQFRAISCGKLRRYFSLENFLDIFRMLKGVMQSLLIIWRFRPDVIFCKGGYVSLPVAIAGGLLRRPVIIHESDVRMGLSNRLAAAMATMICVSFPETLKALRGDKRAVLTGNPVRAGLGEGKVAAGWKLTGLKSGKPVILVMGGSQGAQFINALIDENLPALLKHYQVIHIRGKGNLAGAPARPGYFACEYLGDELPDVYAITDAMISRAGANTLAEIAHLGLPAVLIPLTQGSRGDQLDNARVFAATQATVVLEESQAGKQDLVELLAKARRLHNAGGQAARPAAEYLAELILKTAQKFHAKKS